MCCQVSPPDTRKLSDGPLTVRLIIRKKELIMDEKFKKFREMMDELMSGMNEEEKQEMRKNIFEKLFADMTPEDRMNMCCCIMPEMMKGDKMPEAMVNMMMGMMGSGGRMGGPPWMRRRDWMKETEVEESGDKKPENETGCC